MPPMLPLMAVLISGAVRFWSPKGVWHAAQLVLNSVLSASVIG